MFSQNGDEIGDRSSVRCHQEAMPGEQKQSINTLVRHRYTPRILISHLRYDQVHQNARSLHLTPFTLVPVTYNMTSQHVSHLLQIKVFTLCILSATTHTLYKLQGISTLWRGSIGNGVVWGLSSVTEVILSDLFGLPRTFVENGSASKYWKHILLKA